MKHVIGFSIAIGIMTVFLSCASTMPVEQDEEEIMDTQKNTLLAHDVVTFNELWSYVLTGREETLKAEFPLTDVGYFGAEINNYGKLSGVPDARKLDFYPGRVHLVAVCNSYGMTHMVLSPDLPFRQMLIDDLIHAVVAYDYDGLQIDYELVLAADKEHFLSFLEELAARLDALDSSYLEQGKNPPVFSVALPARTRYLTEDAFDYEAINRIADRVFVMAYDEHWSGGTPGPVASLDWCERVAIYALKTIDASKLIMGQPFYGRTWGDIQPNRAFFHSGMERQITDFNVTDLERTDGILHYSYTVDLTVTAYFDDAQSIALRSRIYKDMGVQHSGFWCLGQEDPLVWTVLSSTE